MAEHNEAFHCRTSFNVAAAGLEPLAVLEEIASNRVQKKIDASFGCGSGSSAASSLRPCWCPYV